MWKYSFFKSSTFWLFASLFLHRFKDFFFIFDPSCERIFGMPYFISTWGFEDPFSTSFKASYVSLIDFVLSFLFAVTVGGHCKV